MHHVVCGNFYLKCFKIYSLLINSVPTSIWKYFCIFLCIKISNLYNLYPILSVSVFRLTKKMQLVPFSLPITKLQTLLVVIGRFFPLALGWSARICGGLKLQLLCSPFSPKGGLVLIQSCANCRKILYVLFYWAIK